MFKNSIRFIVTAVMLFSMWTCVLAQSSGFNVSNMDRSADACEDFFEFANGNWVKNTQIPPSESSWGTFNMLRDNNNTMLKDVLEKAAKTKAAAGSDTQMIGDFYATCMDEAAIEKAGTKPIEKYLKAIANIKTTADLQREIADLHDLGMPAVFGFGAGPDLKSTNTMIVNAGQGGITLPNRDYYTEERYADTRAKFVEYMTNMFKLTGDSPDAASAKAAKVLAMQTRLATASLTPVERRNPDLGYNKITVADAQTLTPNFSWAGYFKERGVATNYDFNVAPTKFFKEVNSMLSDTSIADWKTYLTWMVLNSSASYLPKAYADESFNFFGKHLSGQKERQPRWKICTQNADGALGEALGMEYAKIAFTPAAKARMNAMIDNLMAALKERIGSLVWMSPETKAQALVKLASFKRKIGYPDHLRGYAGLTIKRDSYADNILRANQFQIARNFQDLGKPRDKTRMGMTPPTVNASYSPQNNDITFPAGILQPPFFNFNADDAINYGGIGGVIGHEITHGFDDQGARFDAEGNLKKWWSDADFKQFEDRTSCVAKQFDGYEVQPGLFINGKLTLGENMGDFAGMTVSYYAFMKSLEGKPRPANIDGFTPEQRFFLGWAQVWAGKYTPEAERQQVAGNPHSLPRWRVNGPMSNMPEFAKAFGCKAPQKMVRPDACVIW
ncbi:MAG: M13 family metallopeptidase [Acidobacteriota bacterium]